MAEPKLPPIDGRIAFNCIGVDCKAWNKGQGTRKCLSCQTYLNFQITNKPAPNIYRYPQEFLEEFANPEPQLKTIFDCLNNMPAYHATLILQRFILNMTMTDIAQHYKIRKATVCQQVNLAQQLLKALLGTTKNNR